MYFISVWSTYVAHCLPANHIACLYYHVVELILVHLFLALKTQDSKVTLSNRPNSFDGIKSRWMAWHIHRNKIIVKSISIFLGSVCWCIVHDEHRFLASDLDVFSHLQDEGPEVFWVSWLAFHKNWLVETISYSSEHSSEILLIVNMNYYRFISHIPCFHFTFCPSAKTTFIYVNYGIVVGDYVGQEHCKLLPVFIYADSIL